MARKWAMNRDALTAIVEGRRDHEDAELLRQCDEERARLLEFVAERTCQALAERYGVSQSTIEKIVQLRAIG